MSTAGQPLGERLPVEEFEKEIGDTVLLRQSYRRARRAARQLPDGRIGAVILTLPAGVREPIPSPELHALATRTTSEAVHPGSGSGDRLARQLAG